MSSSHLFLCHYHYYIFLHTYHFHHLRRRHRLGTYATLSPLCRHVCRQRSLFHAFDAITEWLPLFHIGWPLYATLYYYLYAADFQIIFAAAIRRLLFALYEPPPALYCLLPPAPPTCFITLLRRPLRYILSLILMLPCRHNTRAAAALHCVAATMICRSPRHTLPAFAHEDTFSDAMPRHAADINIA